MPMLFWGDAAVPADYAMMMTTTTTIFEYYVSF